MAALMLLWQSRITAHRPHGPQNLKYWVSVLLEKVYTSFTLLLKLHRETKMHDNGTNNIGLEHNPRSTLRSVCSPISQCDFPGNIFEIPIPSKGMLQRSGTASSKGSHWDYMRTFNSQGQMVKSHSSQCECPCQKSNMSKNYSNCFFKLSKFL